MANWAAERLLPTVGPQVSRQISGLGECLAANFTAVGLLSAVCAHVRLERGRASIAFATHLTDVASRLAWRSLGLGHRGMFSNRVNRRRDGSGTHTVSPGNGEPRRNTEGNRFHIVLLFR